MAHHYRTHSHMYYDEDTDSYRLSLWTTGDDNMHVTANLNDHDLTLLEAAIARGRSQKAVYLEDPIAAQKEEV